MVEKNTRTRSYAMLAKCHECMGAYLDGMRDCLNTACPLYNWMPRAKMQADMTWSGYNPTRQGLVTWEVCKQDQTPEQVEACKERARRMHAARQGQALPPGDVNTDTPRLEPVRNTPQVQTPDEPDQYASLPQASPGVGSATVSLGSPDTPDWW